MRLRYHRRRLADFVGAVREARAGSERERWPRERLEAWQQEQLDDLVRHAAANSRYYRGRLGSVRGSVALEDLPPIDKAAMMEHFDEIVCDPRLCRDQLLRWVEGMQRDAIFENRYRVMATSGSSGRKGLFVYDAPGWRAVGSMFMRQSERLGMTPRLPRRRRLAIVTGGSFSHMSTQGGATLRVSGVHRMLGVPMSMPLARIVATLNRFQPEFLNAYPSIAMRLAEEQQAGRLRLALTGMSTSSELRTPEMAARITDAFGVEPLDLYATTEGIWAAECERRDGLHVFEDVALLESVDENNRPVPAGERGAKILVTNLANRVQPIIRLEVSDVVAVDPEPCACGRSFDRIRAIDGRSDDVLSLRGRDGREVRVLPIEFGVVARDRAVREFQIVQEGAAVCVRVVAMNGAGDELQDRVARGLAARLAEIGADATAVRVERVDELPRTAGGKLQIVVADRQAALSAT